MWNITQDLELKATPNWTNVLSFSIATNEKVKINDVWEDKATFHNIVAWWNKAEAISKFFTKWAKILIEWKLENRTWEDQNWNKKYKTEIILRDFWFTWTKTANKDEFTESDKKHFKQEDELSVDDLPF